LSKTNFGRKFYLTTKDKANISSLLDKHSDYNVAEIKLELKLQCTTKLLFWDFIKESGFKFLRILEASKTKTEIRGDRVNFARRHRHDDWTLTLFLDEANFNPIENIWGLMEKELKEKKLL